MIHILQILWIIWRTNKQNIFITCLIINSEYVGGEWIFSLAHTFMIQIVIKGFWGFQMLHEHWQNEYFWLHASLIYPFCVSEMKHHKCCIKISELPHVCCQWNLVSKISFSRLVLVKVNYDCLNIIVTPLTQPTSIS